MKPSPSLIWNPFFFIFAKNFAYKCNHFILGGSVKGGVIHGQYPDDLTGQGSLNIGRGRLIPTTPWEGVWNGMAEWFGVTSQNMASVLPNLVSICVAI